MNQHTLEYGWFHMDDLEEIVKIERQAFRSPWEERDFKEHIAKPDTVCKVCDVYLPSGETLLVGYMLFRIKAESYEIVNMAVHEDYRRDKVGTGFVTILLDKLKPNERTKVTCLVSEINLPACKFFKSLGFVCTSLVRKPYEETDDDAVRFEYSIAKRAPLNLKNRMPK